MDNNILKKVCICVPCYNSEKTIYKTIISLINQTYKNIEIFIIDNASTDRTVDIVKQVMKNHSNVKLFEFNVNVGGNGNFTRCINLSKGDYICIYHADDVYKPNIIEKEVNFLNQHLEVGAVFANASIINEEDEKIIDYYSLKEYKCKPEYSFNELFILGLEHGFGFTTPSAMVREKIYKEEIVVWDRDNFGGAADTDVWLRILRNHRIGFIYEELYFYRLSKFSTSYRMLLQYEDTLSDGFMKVINKNIIEERKEEIFRNKIYINKKVKYDLRKAFLAYIHGDYKCSQQMLQGINIKNINIKMFIIYFNLKILNCIKLPLIVRKTIIYIKYYKLFKGHFKEINISKKHTLERF